MMTAEPPCFVILDLMMPVMDGWEVAGRMHEDPRLEAIPVCVVTATPEWAPSDSVCVMPKPIDVQSAARRGADALRCTRTRSCRRL